jgi:long-chain acyl-CoA synthetase
MRYIADLINYGLNRFPDRHAVTEGTSGHAITFREVDDRASRVVSAWQAAGVQAGDRVALLFASDIEYLELHVAAQRAGVIALPLNTRTPVEGLRELVADTAPTLLVHGAENAETAAALGVRQTWHLGEEGYGLSYRDLLASVRPADAAPIDADAPSLILFTSGSTGKAKGVVLTNAIVYSRIRAYAWDAEVSSDDVMVQFLPIFQMPVVLNHTITMCGGRNIVYPDFDAHGFAEAVRTHKATTSVLVPTMINMVCSDPRNAAADFASLRTIIYGGSGIPASVLSTARQLLRCNMNQYFGQTECAPMTTLRPAEHTMDPRLLRSAGKPEQQTEIRIVDANGTPVPRGTEGEILARSPHTMAGYWGAHDAAEDVIDADGWVHSGDVGYLDDNGFLFVVDRRKDMIVSGGFNVGSIEVEDVITRFPGVHEVAVIGIPDERWGEAVHAIVVTKPGTSIRIDDLLTFCAKRLDPFKVPKSVEFRPGLPKNLHQKVLKTQLREPYWSGYRARVS